MIEFQEQDSALRKLYTPSEICAMLPVLISGQNTNVIDGANRVA